MVKNLKVVFVCNNVLEKVQNPPPKMFLNVLEFYLMFFVSTLVAMPMSFQKSGGKRHHRRSRSAAVTLADDTPSRPDAPRRSSGRQRALRKSFSTSAARQATGGSGG